MKLNAALPEFSASGIAAAYVTWAAATGAEIPVDPFWIALAALALFFGLGLYRAYADDKRITVDEVASLIGVGSREFEDALNTLRDERAQLDKETVDD